MLFFGIRQSVEKSYRWGIRREFDLEGRGQSVQSESEIWSWIGGGSFSGPLELADLFMDVIKALEIDVDLLIHWDIIVFFRMYRPRYALILKISEQTAEFTGVLKISQILYVCCMRRWLFNLGSSTNRVGNHVYTGVVGAPRDYTLWELETRSTIHSGPAGSHSFIVSLKASAMSSAHEGQSPCHPGMDQHNFEPRR